MTTITEIIEELNAENGSNYKMEVLKRHSANHLLLRVLQMTYDLVEFNYGITTKTISMDSLEARRKGSSSLADGLDQLELFYVTGKITGNSARTSIMELMADMSEEDAVILWRVIGRDQRINMGRTQINKVIPNLIKKPVYMRCSTYTEKTAKKIKYPAIIQLKADGTYRESRMKDGIVTFMSRSGEDYEYPVLSSELAKFDKDGYVFGELTVLDENGVVMPRALGNGLLNSDDVPHDRIVFDVWDMCTIEEYERARLKSKTDKNTREYDDRFSELKECVSKLGDDSNINIIEYEWVNSASEAMLHTQKWMKMKLEGGVLKNAAGVLRDGTSPDQLKMKLVIQIEVRITGFHEGKKGTVREKTFGSMTFETDDQKIKGKCSGFDAKTLKDFNSRREELIGKIMTVECSDIDIGRDNDYYSLTHPRFTEIRDDRDDTDTLETALAAKETAMQLT